MGQGRVLSTVRTSAPCRYGKAGAGTHCASRVDADSDNESVADAVYRY